MAKLDKYGWLKRAENKTRKLRNILDKRYAANDYDPELMHGLASISMYLQRIRDNLDEEFVPYGRPMARPTPTLEQNEIERVFLAKVKAQNAEIRSLYR